MEILELPPKFDSIEELFDWLIDNYTPLKLFTELVEENLPVALGDHRSFFRELTYFILVLGTKVPPKQYAASLRTEMRRRTTAILLKELMQEYKKDEDR